MARIKNHPTVYDGIEFRSRLEASWYAYLTMCDFGPIVYEPEAFSVEIGSFDYGRQHFESYMPDFKLNNGMYVEVKPDLPSFSGHDVNSIMRAYSLGYTYPTAIIIGSPLYYFAALIEERGKGNPRGWVIQFNGRGYTCSESDWFQPECYPDEVESTYVDPRKRYEEHYRAGISPYAQQAWNVTKWKR